ncbi:LacI family DNA-binding transcriptional regulator [Opitutus sp. ER46]|uniref:LacI family DNA-binding transcriptional regulator n=1 Tax=Opitutus sp. ER46 TaxID=2161864 RepID=UPI000D31BEA2|nr:LacI family DNA-binding transcriptional regulator [Opitutus sp. ER46]PTX90837.1 LacI family transcriptional regulator [Opitutus sp. ER46]
MPRVTLNDIAKKVGYSKNTVSLALRGDPQIPPSTRDRIRQVAETLGYQPNAIVAHLMAQLRASQSPRFQAKLALVNANRDQDAFRTHPTIPTYVEGCERRASRLGYGFDRFWLHDPNMRAETWIRVLRTRNINGIILVGLMDQNRLPAHLRPVWETFPTVVTGVRTREPALSFSCVDHHSLVLSAFENALTLGYQRPALVLDDVIDRLVDRRFSAGFLTAQEGLPSGSRIPAFRQLTQAWQNPKVFHTWLDRYKPDVLFTLYNAVFDWLKARGKRVPEDIGVIQLEWRASKPDIAGMNQHNDVTGEAAVDLVVSQIHNNEYGVPSFPRATLIGSTWMPGKTVRTAAALQSAQG